MVGLVDDCAVRAGVAFGRAGELIALLGPAEARHLGGSEYLRTVHKQWRGLPPPLDLDLEKRVQAAVRALVREGLVRTAHDCSDGGLAFALAECCLAGGLGCAVDLPGAGRADALLFGEDASRVVVAFAAGAHAAVAARCAALGAPFTVLGSVGGDRLVVRRANPAGKPAGAGLLLDEPVAALRLPWEAAVPGVVGEQPRARPAGAASPA
jgi:phosphoribosylformylglycinamidine synthase